MILDPIQDGTAQPSKIEAFDAKRRKRDVNLDSPFFAVKRTPIYPDCDHRNRGVTLDVATRTAICKCGVTIDTFDALLIYAHAERRLQSTRAALDEHARKEAEQKAKRPFAKKVNGFQAIQQHGRLVGYTLTLDCDHTMRWYHKRPPRTATCETCYRRSRIQPAPSPAPAPPVRDTEES